MEILKSKWFLFVVIPLLILVVLFLLGKKSVHSEIIIKASSEKVWSVLMDKSTYREWNTVLIPIEGDLVEGTTVKYEFWQDDSIMSEIPSKVIKIEDLKLLNQTGGMTGILTYNHKYILEEVSEGTKLSIHEDYRGIGVNFWNPASVQKAYDRLCKNLKTRAEQ